MDKNQLIDKIVELDKKIDNNIKKIVELNKKIETRVLNHRKFTTLISIKEELRQTLIYINDYINEHNTYLECIGDQTPKFHMDIDFDMLYKVVEVKLNILEMEYMAYNTPISTCQRNEHWEDLGIAELTRLLSSR